MANLSSIVASAVTALLALTASNIAVASATASNEQEKCYGIVKAGSNDCSTATASCAGSSTIDKQPDAFIFLPKGTCEKIVGGSTTAPHNLPSKLKGNFNAF